MKPVLRSAKTGSRLNNVNIMLPILFVNYKRIVYLCTEKSYMDQWSLFLCSRLSVSYFLFLYSHLHFPSSYITFTIRENDIRMKLIGIFWRAFWTIRLRCLRWIQTPWFLVCFCFVVVFRCRVPVKMEVQEDDLHPTWWVRHACGMQSESPLFHG